MGRHNAGCVGFNLWQSNGVSSIVGKEGLMTRRTGKRYPAASADASPTHAIRLEMMMYRRGRRVWVRWVLVLPVVMVMV